MRSRTTLRERVLLGTVAALCAMVIAVPEALLVLYFTHSVFGGPKWAAESLAFVTWILLADMTSRGLKEGYA